MRLNPAESGVVSTEGEAVRARRERLGMDKSALAVRAKVNRDTVNAIEDGQGFRQSSLTKIRQALDAVEEERGLKPAPRDPDSPIQHASIVVEQGEGSSKVRVAVEGSHDPDELAALARKLLRDVLHNNVDEPPSH